MTRVRSSKRGQYWRDQGHYGRKAVFYAYAILTLPIPIIAWVADQFDRYVYDPIVYRGHKISVWANPCLYADTSEIPKRES